MKALLRDPASDSEDLKKRFTDPEKGLYQFFRVQSIALQNRFCKLFPVERTPSVFLHGNPHIDNYARTFRGSGMVDFDRSRMGPYSWDLCRLLGSLELRADKKENFSGFLPNSIIDQVLHGYMSRLENPNLSFEPIRFLESHVPQWWEVSTNAYLSANKRWAKKMRQNPLPIQDTAINKLVQKYAVSRNHYSLLEKYYIEEAGYAFGSLGKKRFLVVLAPTNESSDRILLDIKSVYEDSDTKWFYNPYRRHGHRMVEASTLYAQNLEQKIGYAEHDGQEYWVRQVPSFQVKIKGQLNKDQLKEFGFCVGAQLAIGHQRSLLFSEPDYHKKHLMAHFPLIVEVAQKLNEELRSAYDKYLNKVKN